MAESDITYKIIVLEMLSKADFKLSNSQITDFFLGQQYTDYFSVQKAINQLEDQKFIESENTHGNTLYALTDSGADTLGMFAERITPSIQEDMKRYFEQHSMEMKKDNAVFADYYSATGGGYLVHIKCREKNQNIMDITLRVPTKEQAEAICNNWRVRCEDVYEGLMDILI